MSPENGLIDSVPISDTRTRELAYNNTTDRTRIELPPSGDIAGGGQVQIGLDNWAGGLPVAVPDGVRVQSASGTQEIPVYLTEPIEIIANVGDEMKVLSASGTQELPVYIENNITTHIDGTVDVVGTVIASAGINLNTSALALESGGNLDTIAGNTTSIDGKITACNTGAVIVSSSVLPAGAATAVNQLADGHNVTVDNAGGVSAVNIQDGGNTITVDGSVAVTASDLDVRDLNQSQDNLRIYSASGTQTIPVYIADEPVDVIDTDPAVNRIKENSWTTMSAPGLSEPVAVETLSKHTIQYVIENIDTNVEVNASGSLDGTYWFNLDSIGSTITQTDNGTYFLTVDAKMKYIAFAFLTETGGTNVTIVPKYLGGH